MFYPTFISLVPNSLSFLYFAPAFLNGIFHSVPAYSYSLDLLLINNWFFQMMFPFCVQAIGHPTFPSLSPPTKKKQSFILSLLLFYPTFLYFLSLQRAQEWLVLTWVLRLCVCWAGPGLEFPLPPALLELLPVVVSLPSCPWSLALMLSFFFLWVSFWINAKLWTSLVEGDSNINEGCKFHGAGLTRCYSTRFGGIPVKWSLGWRPNP